MGKRKEPVVKIFKCPYCMASFRSVVDPKIELKRCYCCSKSAVAEKG